MYYIVVFGVIGNFIDQFHLIINLCHWRRIRLVLNKTTKEGGQVGWRRFTSRIAVWLDWFEANGILEEFDTKTFEDAYPSFANDPFAIQMK